MCVLWVYDCMSLWAFECMSMGLHVWVYEYTSIALFCSLECMRDWVWVYGYLSIRIYSISIIWVCENIESRRVSTYTYTYIHTYIHSWYRILLEYCTLRTVYRTRRSYWQHCVYILYPVIEHTLTYIHTHTYIHTYIPITHTLTQTGKIARASENKH